MDKEQAKKRIDKLKETIRYYRYLYHVKDKQEISDEALDSLKHELKNLEEQYPEFITLDSPTQRVGGEPLDEFKKVKHNQPMLSLEDVFSSEELNDWESRIQKLVPEDKFNYFVEYKIDGFAVALIYEKGNLVLGATRGNGEIGEDVTENLKTIESIPLRIKLYQKISDNKIQDKLEKLIKSGKIEVRGEVFMTKEAFKQVNRERKNKGLEEYSNPRNTAAGTVRQLNPKVVASRDLSFLAYSVITDLGQTKHHQEHEITEALGFKVDKGRVCYDLKGVVDYWKSVYKKRESLSYQIDGVVVNVNNESVFDKLGVVGKAPRGAVALKFLSEKATTVVKDIKVQVGRTGILTPVAELKPIKIGGVKVTRASLHNMDEIKRLGVKIGDTVVVERAGDVIPKIVKVIKRMRSGDEKNFKMPKKCPICGGLVKRAEGEAYYRCTNKDCGAVHKQQLIHFVSRKGFDIDGLGEKIIEQLMDEGLVSNASDLFSLTKGDLIPLERFAEKSAENLVEAINESKKINLVNFIYALGIDHVGEETAFILAKELVKAKKNKNIEKPNEISEAFHKITKESLEEINDIGPVVAKSIFDYFNNKKNIKLLNDLDKSGIVLDASNVPKTKGSLEGKTFVLTGELENYTREDSKAKIRDNGGSVSSSVSKNTDYLVVGKNPGSKYRQAKRLGVKIINESEFLKKIN